MTAHCYKCGITQTKENTHLDKNRHTGLSSRCIQCQKKYDHNRWKEQKDEIYIKHRNYAVSLKGREVFRNAHRRFRESDKGKILSKKCSAKRRNLGFKILCENTFSEKTRIAWHHIDDELVVALPERIHQEISGFRDKNKHRRLMLDIIELFYPENIYNICLEKTF